MGFIAKDKDIRECLLTNFYSKYSTENTSIINEFELFQGAARIDIAVVNGFIHGYEIKSDADSLIRLKKQADVYNSTLEKVTIVSGDKYLDKISALIPSWWGIIRAYTVENSVKTVCIRTAKVNRNINKYYLSRLLWKNEAITLLKQFNKYNNCSGKNRFYLWQKVADEIPITYLRKFIRDSIKVRNYNLTRV